MMKALKIAPHSFFFLLLSALYGIPTILTLFFCINEEYSYVSDNVLSSYRSIRWDVLFVYVIAVISFLLGSKLTNDFLQRSKRKYYTSNIQSLVLLSRTQKILLYLFIALGLLMLMRMVQAGTFSASYMDSFDVGFEAQNMFTMLCDVFFFFFVYLSFKYKNNYKKTKLLLLLMIIATLLKGSRMFTVPLLFFVLYRIIYVDGLTRKKILGILCGGVMVLLGLCSVFFLRHDTSLENINVWSMLFLLVQYESCGVHIPLFKEIVMDWHTSFTPMFTYLTDTLLFAVPRFFFPEKNSYLYFDSMVREYNLSPFGGINGEASVILYWGIFFPFFFFLVGSFLSSLYFHSKYNQNIKILYIFICCSLIFTFLRNGILIATKSLLIITIIMGILLFIRRLTIKF